MFNKFGKENDSILLLGEIEILNNNFSNKSISINTFFYDKIGINQLINSIDNNDYKIVKGKKIFLNQLLYSSDKVYIGVKRLNNNLELLIDKINNNRVHEIIIVSNNCKKSKYTCINIDEYKNYFK